MSHDRLLIRQNNPCVNKRADSIPNVKINTIVCSQTTQYLTQNVVMPLPIASDVYLQSLVDVLINVIFIQVNEGLF